MEGQVLILLAGIFLMAVLYSLVGHGGASGYIAIMALLGFATDDYPADGPGSQYRRFPRRYRRLHARPPFFLAPLLALCSNGHPLQLPEGGASSSLLIFTGR